MDALKMREMMENSSNQVSAEDTIAEMRVQCMDWIINANMFADLKFDFTVPFMLVPR